MTYSIFQQVKLRLGEYTVDDSGAVTFTAKNHDVALNQIIEQAIKEVKRTRRYPSSYTDDQISADISKYEGVIVDLALYDSAKIGGEFQESDSENGKSRTWVNRETILRDVYPLAVCIS